MKRLLLSLLLWPCLSFADPDLSHKEGLRAACAALPAAATELRTNAQRQAFAVCRDIALVQQIIRWLHAGVAKFSAGPDEQEFQTELRKELTDVRDRLKETRLVLATLKLKSGEGLMLAPGEWQLDLDGDGKIDTWEQMFFAIPKRNADAAAIGLPRNDPAHYQQHYQSDAKFRVDESDVLWALAYHQFAEGMIEILLGHRFKLAAARDESIEVGDPAALLRAHHLIGEGIATSTALRRSLLAETDDADEWIPNPLQQNSVFPLALDLQAYDTWGLALAELAPLWAGKTLLVADRNGGGLLGAAAKRCEPGEGLDVAALFRKPARFPMAQDSMRSACVKVDGKRPASGLVALINMVAARSSHAKSPTPEWQFVRYLYWVN